MTNTATLASNPLLDFSDLAQFDRIAPEHVGPAMAQLLAESSAALEAVTAPGFPAQWTEISKVLDVSTERLGRAWGSITHLKSVADAPALRAAYNESLPKVTEFYTRLGADERLYAKYKSIPVDSLNAEQRQAHKNAIRNFVLGGAELLGAARERFAAIQERMAELSQKFSENSLDATDSYAYFASAQELAGVPDDVLQAALAAAKADGKDGYKITLKIPCYLPVMQFAQSGALRERLYRAYVTRASDQSAEAAAQAAPTGAAGATGTSPAIAKYDNTALMNEILALRLEEASLLGYRNYGELSVAPKMASSPEEVIRFLRDLGAKAKPFAVKDLADLRDFAAQHLNLPHLNYWDIPFASEKLKEARYAFSEQEVKQYFTAPKVLAGLFKIIETLFEVSIRPDSAPVWHPSVEFYRLERLQTLANGQTQTVLVGQFYLDPTARNGKRGGAWMDDVRARWLRPDNGQLQTPVAHLVCNFADGVMVDGVKKPALLTHDDVTTLFHEFGHGLHHMLTQVNERDVSGISGVEWDAVELPSQFMENFCWEWDVLKHMTAHADTGAPLPRALFDKMLAAKNYQTGMQTLRQIEFSLFDMLLHTEHQPSDALMPLLAKVRAEVAVVQHPDWSRPMHTFGHIFSGGYAAGYYSYKWAEVLSADAYAAFEETAGNNGLPNAETGRKYRHAILEAGGSRPAMESFKAFRGREPQLDALLRHQGMASN